MERRGISSMAPVSLSGNMTSTLCSRPTTQNARQPTTRPTTTTLPTEAKHMKRSADRLLLKHIGDNNSAATVTTIFRTASSLRPPSSDGKASSPVGAKRSCKSTKYATCVSQQITNTHPTVSRRHTSPKAACPTNSKVSRPVQRAHSTSMSRVQALTAADSSSAKVPSTRPHWLIAKGSDRTPPPTIVATRENVAEWVRIVRLASSKGVPRYSSRRGPNCGLRQSPGPPSRTGASWAKIWSRVTWISSPLG
mmetsp:Transcript_53681/g.163038  ORF Transcript_53681/g.163038 Transcript_53681/m.163038 type:complete len:251 (+) Transcript_53681:762-1514(+)